MTADMRVGTHNGHLMVSALKRHRDKPVMYLGDAGVYDAVRSGLDAVLARIAPN